MNNQNAVRIRAIFIFLALVLMVIGGLTPTASPKAAQSAQDVTVVNTEKNPVPVFDVENPAKQPFQTSVLSFIEAGSPSGHAFFRVPAGKRLVIEYISGILSVPFGQSIVTFELTTTASRLTANHSVQISFAGVLAGSSQFTAGQLVKIYADPGTIVGVGAFRNTYTGTGRVSVTISGYLLDVP